HALRPILHGLVNRSHPAGSDLARQKIISDSLWKPNLLNRRARGIVGLCEPERSGRGPLVGRLLPGQSARLFVRPLIHPFPVQTGRAAPSWDRSIVPQQRPYSAKIAEFDKAKI